MEKNELNKFLYQTKLTISDLQLDRALIEICDFVDLHNLDLGEQIFELEKRFKEINEGIEQKVFSEEKAIKAKASYLSNIKNLVDKIEKLGLKK